MLHYDEPSWQIAHRIRFDFNNLMADTIGEAHGFTEAELGRQTEVAQAALAAVQAKRDTGWLRWMGLPYQPVDDLLATAADVRARFKNFVVLGIGGSALGAIALQDALLHPYHNQLPDDARGGPRLYVLDNIDPDWLLALLDVLNPTETCFDVITKSGSTAETMSQFLWTRQLLVDRLGEQRYAEHVIATTDAAKGSLRPLVDQENYHSCVVPDGVGGRFSVLSAVGLLPAAVAGIDIRGLLAGAAYADRISATPDLWQNTALMYALTQYLAYRRGQPLSVMMPYAQGLRTVADWYAQLWAESLGKAEDHQGQVVNVGPTPIKALGATDQHSQAQLYIAGPRDKIFTFVTVDKFANELPIPTWRTGQSAVDYLGGHTINELLAAEAEGTALALAAAGRPNATFKVSEVNAFTLGQLFYLLEIATAISGELYNIDAFNQPGVEAGKVRAYALLGRPGYEAQAAEIEALRGKRKARYEI
ncbi:MAG: glucose-6-phosphate isomerase [Chloroflexi bacterium HGW-Chloroflexi-1]|nr:MAG: glucose-6-phosphate isomerase [Chloroflexi bacterium HGW-Chloroflexi-1]